MQTRMLPVKAFLALACLLAVALAAAGAAAPQAAKQAKQPEKEKKEAPKEEPQGGGGLFTGFRKAAGTERKEERASVTAGAKGANPVGKDIGNVAISSTDRSKVASMEGAKPSEKEMTAFFQEGKLSPVHKGGGSQ